MADYTLYTLRNSDITISDSASLSNASQGNGSQLLGKTIILNTNQWVEVLISDSDANFEDSDNSQTLVNSIMYDGQPFAAGSRVEAEYRFVVQDPDGNSYTIIGFNINEPGVTSYTTVEGLAFLGPVAGFPPRNVVLTVTSTSEGPSGTTTPYATYATPPCFTVGTHLDTPTGRRRVENISVGDLVSTQDHGPQTVRWIGRRTLSLAELTKNPQFQPVLITKNAFGPNAPNKDLLVSPQHRILVNDPHADLLFGDSSVLVAAKFLVNATTIKHVANADVTYIHILFDRHEVVSSYGVWTESFCPGPHVLPGLATECQAELLALFPALSNGQQPLTQARTSLTRKEAAVLAMACAA